MHTGNNVPSHVWAKVLIKCKTRGNHHGIDPLYWVMIHLIDPVQVVWAHGIVLAHGIEKGAHGIEKG